MKNVGLFTVGEAPGGSPEIQMQRLALGHVAAKAVYIFAKLEIADILHEGPLPISELAKQVGAHAETLDRVLQFLASVEVVRVLEDGCFALTPLGRTLRSKPSSAIRDNVLLLGSPTYWASFGSLLHSVKTGEIAYEHANGAPQFEYLAQHPEAAAELNNAMSSSARLGAAAFLKEYPFASFKTIVDVGGGQGGLLSAILKQNPDLHGTLYDAPSVVAGAPIDPALTDRMTVRGGNFFEHVPPGADAYILRRILHDWDDQKSLDVLRVVRKAISGPSKLLLIELAAPPPGENRNNWQGVDLVMLTLGGQERDEEHFKKLFAASGFTLSQMIRTKSPFWIVEAIPV